MHTHIHTPIHINTDTYTHIHKFAVKMKRYKGRKGRNLRERAIKYNKKHNDKDAINLKSSFNKTRKRACKGPSYRQ
jgi:hypothetical protein